VPYYIFGERYLHRVVVVSHVARNRIVLRDVLFLHKQVERSIAPASGDNLERADMLSVCLLDRSNDEVLQDPVYLDARGEFTEPDIWISVPDVGFGRDEF